MIRGTLGFTLIATFGSLMACDEPLYIGNDPSKLIGSGKQKDAPQNPASEKTPLSLDQCVRNEAGSFVAGACAFDANSKTYLQDGVSSIVVSNVSPFGVAFRFAAGYEPAASDLSLNSSTASIEVYASANLDLAYSPGPAGTSKYIQASSELRADGSLIVTVLDPIPNGYMVSVELHVGALYRSRLPSSNGAACSLPDPWYCAEADHLGYAIRFTVNGEPTPPVPGGSCLLAYNSALVDSGADDCCYYQGQQNYCNTAVQCNELSGGYCCLIYGTENTAGGARCCLYEGGEFGDSAEECKALLGKAPSGGPVTPLPSDSCLLEYNTALVSPDADPCCYRQGQPNQCSSAVKCNELSGASCCLIYGTENTAGGGRCCLYEDGRLGDSAEECKTLLGTSGAI